MIEVVTRSNTISKIQKQCAGAVGAFKDEVLFKWLSEKNPDEMSLKMAIENVCRPYTSPPNSSSLLPLVEVIASPHTSSGSEIGTTTI